MKQQWRNTLIFVIVVAALGIYVIKFERGEVREKPLALKLNADEVTNLEVKATRTKNPIAFERKGEKKWEIVKPYPLRADNQTVNDLFDRIKDLEQVRMITKNPTKSELTSYGLELPIATITLRLKGGKTTVIKLGNKTFDSSDVYAQLQGNNKVFLVHATLFDNADKELKDFRDKTALVVDKDKVEKFALTYAKGALEFQKTGDEWKLTKPVDAPADKTEADNLLQKVVDLKADSWVEDNPRNIKRFSLDKPWIRVDVWERGDARGKSLFIGKKYSKDTTKVFAQNSAEKPVFLLADSVLTDLKKSAKDMRDKKIVRAEKDDVTKFTLKNKYGSIGVEKSGDDWKFFTPSTERADTSTVDSILYAVQDLKADDFIDKPQPLKVYGLDKPQIELSITAKSATSTLLVGRQSADKTSLFVKLDIGNTVYKVGTSLLDSLSKKAADLRDKEVLKFDRKDLKQFTVKREGKPNLTIVRSGKDKWSIISPERVEADSGKLSTTLFTLESLTAESIAGDLPADAAQAKRALAYYGLDKPRIQVDLDIKGKQPVTLLIGKRTKSGDKVFFMLQGDKTVFVKSDYLVTDLEKEVKDLKK